MKAEEILRVNQYFEPSLKVKQFWLKTRKAKKTYGGLEFHGFFITDEGKYMWDALMCFIVLILEGFGVFAIILSTSTYWILKVGGVIFLSAFDFLLAALSRKDDDEINLHYNKITITNFEKNLVTTYDATNRAVDKIQDYNKKIREYKNKSYWFLGGLLCVCFIKIFLFFFEIKGGLGGWFLMQNPIYYFRGYTIFS
ncbi:MAG: hypothetical protein HY096_09435 [Nitrospinae bacterium]|nr:hypothetical protein [Nitrospinota bacterium]